MVGEIKKRGTERRILKNADKTNRHTDSKNKGQRIMENTNKAKEIEMSVDEYISSHGLKRKTGDSGRHETPVRIENIPVINDVRGLSSGTIASISGVSLYSQAEDIQERFFQWLWNSNSLFRTWQEAWRDFQTDNMQTA